MQSIIFATKNEGKVREFKTALAPFGLNLISLNELTDVPDIVENGQTFEENARIKAQTIATYLNQPVIAEDSGLIVDALNGAPGIYSARYAGDHDDKANNQKLLVELKKVAPSTREAAFQTDIVAIKPNGSELVASGQVQGMILEHAQGTNGFGYDPLFYYEPYHKTLAELSVAQKNEISHRGAALRQFVAKFDLWWEEK
ncbi:XTP/dITP diphosphatase [Weissella diestrammenae]|uniref:dITP/XTP pyrophosphatase n=1 Tax=Weissella diestrammenae TaxID=1162633 RepID=A0A7G9T5S6_9LACO|nr:XTP/dITP diphosphatase [Weissella diestrammenae]MCM0582279.1 XTP/dITP diphosphatase [Weissella diestrammenae]QNN75451.1 XTP/dITP diphosphatase [Weissella diestrammenae]